MLQLQKRGLLVAAPELADGQLTPLNAAGSVEGSRITRRLMRHQLWLLLSVQGMKRCLGMQQREGGAEGGQADAE